MTHIVVIAALALVGFWAATFFENHGRNGAKWAVLVGVIACMSLARWLLRSEGP